MGGWNFSKNYLGLC